MKKKFGQFYKKVKAVVIPVGSVALALAGNGAFGPKGLAAAAAVSSIIALFSRRPQDPHPSDPTPESPEAGQ